MDGAHSWAVDLAEELIAEEGKPMTFSREVAAESVDQDTPWRPDGIAPSPPTPYNLIGIAFPYEDKLVDGDVIRRSDLRCYVAAKGLTYVPTAGDYVVTGGTKYKIVDSSPLEPGTERILYDIQLRA